MLYEEKKTQNVYSVFWLCVYIRRVASYRACFTAQKFILSLFFCVYGKMKHTCASVLIAASKDNIIFYDNDDDDDDLYLFGRDWNILSPKCANRIWSMRYGSLFFRNSSAGFCLFVRVARLVCVRWAHAHFCCGTNWPVFYVFIYIGTTQQRFMDFKWFYEIFRKCTLIKCWCLYVSISLLLYMFIIRIKSNI